MNDGSRWWLHIRTMTHCTPMRYVSSLSVIAFNYKWKIIGPFSHLDYYNNSICLSFHNVKFTYMAIFLSAHFHILFNSLDRVYLHPNCMEIILIKTMNGFNISFNEWEFKKKLTTYIKTCFKNLTTIEQESQTGQPPHTDKWREEKNRNL